MIRHCVNLTFTPGTTEAQVQAILDGLAGLPGAIPEIRAYTFGRDLGLAEGNASLTVVADFDDVDGYVVYRDHPAHQKVIAEAIRPVLASRAAGQFAY